MEPVRLTRRGALALGGLALAARGLRVADPLAAAARAPRAASFAMDVPDGAWRRGARAAGASGGAFETAPLDAPRRFDLLGVSWRSGPRDVRVEVRVRRPGRRGAARWSRWVLAPPGGDHAPDGARALPRVTDPVWAGGCDAVQVRLSHRVGGLRLRFVDALGGGRLARAAAHGRRPRAVRVAGSPPIVPRSEWVDAACAPRVNPGYGTVALAFVHHTVTANDYGPGESAAMVRGVCLYHRDVRGWNDIGYNFLVDRYGQVFEGRAGGVDAAVIGAQAQGWNAQSTGIGNLGTFDTVEQTAAGMEALARLIAWKLPLHGTPVSGRARVRSGGGADNRYRLGEEVWLERVSGHRDGDATDCPGNALYRQLPALRRRAAALAGPVGALSISVAQDVPYGEPVAVSGVLLDGDGRPVPGALVAVERPHGDRGFFPLTQARTAADGTWSAAVNGRRDRVLRASFGGAGEAPRVVSDPVWSAVLPQVSLAMRDKHVPVGGRAVAEARVKPGPGIVRLLVERRTRRHDERSYERVLKRTCRVGRGGRVRHTGFRPDKPGLYRVRLVPPGGVPRSQRELWPRVHVRVLRGG